MRTGTLEDPFSQLSDALEKAKELGAPYLNTLKITVHMFKGDHFIVQERYDTMNIFHATKAID